FFGESAAVRHRHDAIARLDGSHTVTNRVDDTGDFGSRRERERRLHLILALNLKNVEEIQCRHAIGDADLSRRWLRIWYFFERHRFGLAPGVYSPRFHFPWNLGFRFSWNAAVPSLTSSV